MSGAAERTGRLGSFAPGIGTTLGAAMVFGASTPFAKQLGEGVNPLIVAGLLYFGSGLGLSISLGVVRSTGRESALERSDARALAVVLVFGGMLAPALLLLGLRTTPAASASLLLNLEAVFTALGAWLVVREHADRRLVAGMVVIVAGGALLSIQPEGRFAFTAGSLAIAAACACWGVDNVATRPLAVREPRQVAAVKGIVAGTVNVSLGLAVGGSLPAPGRIAATMATGLIGYGISFVLYLRAVRFLGTARTGAYYSAAPFIGAAIALVWLREPVGPWFFPALGLMAVGLTLHVTEHHGHDHVHVALTHAHAHTHDDPHHSHSGAHDASPNALDHTHEPVEHEHGHTPDVHHRHDH